MFGTSIHWTTFFYLLIDCFVVLFAFLQASKLKYNNLNRYLTLGVLFVLYNFTGGFLPFDNFPAPFILQYIITYGVAIAMCLYTVYYFYTEYDISVFGMHLNIANISIVIVGCFLGLFLLPYFLLDSIDKARILFTLPVFIICMYILWAFYRRISHSPNPNNYILRRNRLSLVSLACIALLPILTVVGDYQWITFTVVNTAFYLVTAIEIDRFLYFLERKGKLNEVFGFYKDKQGNLIDPMFDNKGLTRREMEIALSILDNQTYKRIGEDFFIAENTVSKHASNIYKKLNVSNRLEFLRRFASRKG